MRKFIFLILFISTGLLYLFDLDKLVAKKFSFLNDLKLTYINKILDLPTVVIEHFNQSKNIANLLKENRELKEYKILYNNTQQQLDTVKKIIADLDIHDFKPKIEFVKVLSYINYNDFTKVWLDKKRYDNKILGLISQDYAAGIVVTKNNTEVALLNGNKECSYAVYIGENQIPGIATASKNKDEMLIKFIPTWAEVKKGDEVVTSGMDNIFFSGLKVGVVTDVTKFPDMKVATIKPYAKVFNKKYFYTYENLASPVTSINDTSNKK